MTSSLEDQILHFHNYNISFLASGTSEAFMHAVATERQLKRSNDSLLIFSLIYIVLNVMLIRLAGAVGLILANSLSILSIPYSYLFHAISQFTFVFSLWKAVWVLKHFSYYL